MNDTSNASKHAIELNDDNFAEIIDNNPLVVVDFWAEWCGPCKNFAPVFETAAEKNPDIIFAKVDTESAQQLAAQFQIRSIPTLMIFKEQIVVFSQAGALPASTFDTLIEQAKGLDMETVRQEIAQKQTVESAPA